MKSKNLMIGDLVLYNGKVEKMTAERIACFDFAAKNPYSEEASLLVKYEPIPLTEEILKANGWHVLSNFDRDTFYSENGEFNLDVHNGELRLIIHSHVIIIKYVHQLQHALRLCELLDLADNLKVNQ